MNAIFDASDALMSLFEGERTEDILISDEDSIKISIGFDTQRLVISIRDNFGTVEKPSVLKALMRCELMGIDQGSSNPSGAGIGLYMAFKSLNQLNFVIEKNVATEVVAGHLKGATIAQQAAMIRDGTAALGRVYRVEPDVLVNALAGKMVEIEMPKGLASTPSIETDLGISAALKATMGALNPSARRSSALSSIPDPSLSI